jgi:hypothetical protein
MPRHSEHAVALHHRQQSAAAALVEMDGVRELIGIVQRGDC